MDGPIALAIIGVVVAFNFLVIKVKFERKRYADGSLDLFLLTIASLLFEGSFSGLIVATVSSFVVSVYLFMYPPKLPKFTALGNFKLLP